MATHFQMIQFGFTAILTNREHLLQRLIPLYLPMEQVGIITMFVTIGTAFLVLMVALL